MHCRSSREIRLVELSVPLLKRYIDPIGMELNPSTSRSRTGSHRSEEHTSELQSHSDLHSFPTRRSSDLEIRLVELSVPLLKRYIDPIGMELNPSTSRSRTGSH